jgi:hypothetical protein
MRSSTLFDAGGASEAEAALQRPPAFVQPYLLPGKADDTGARYRTGVGIREDGVLLPNFGRTFGYFAFDPRVLDHVLQQVLSQVEDLGRELARWVASLVDGRGDNAHASGRGDGFHAVTENGVPSAGDTPIVLPGVEEVPIAVEEELVPITVPSLQAQVVGLIEQFFPVDFGAIESAVQEFLEQAEVLVEEADKGLTAWLSAIAAGALAYEVARREMRRPLGEQLPVPDAGGDPAAV